MENADATIQGRGSRPVTAISTRTLVRESAAVLDRVSREHVSILITRGGLPVAILQPLDGVRFQPFAASVGDAGGGLETRAIPEVDLSPYELNADACHFLLAMDGARHYMHAMRYARDQGSMRALLGRLEVRGVIRKTLSDYVLTSEGRAVIETLQHAGWTKETEGEWLPGLCGRPAAQGHPDG
jgi:prevent-host-death family protein